MGSQAHVDKEYRELELYLQQAQEDISVALTKLMTPQGQGEGQPHGPRQAGSRNQTQCDRRTDPIVIDIATCVKQDADNNNYTVLETDSCVKGLVHTPCTNELCLDNRPPLQKELQRLVAERNRQNYHAATLPRRHAQVKAPSVERAERLIASTLATHNLQRKRSKSMDREGCQKPKFTWKGIDPETRKYPTPTKMVKCISTGTGPVIKRGPDPPRKLSLGETRTIPPIVAMEAHAMETKTLPRKLSAGRRLQHNSGDQDNNRHTSNSPSDSAKQKVSKGTQTSKTVYATASLERNHGTARTRAYRKRRELEQEGKLPQRRSLEGTTLQQKATDILASPQRRSLDGAIMNNSSKTAKNKQQEFCLDEDSLDMQVVVNSSTPVLLRRRPSKRSSARNNVPQDRTEKYNTVAGSPFMQSVQVQCPSLDGDYSNTWHGSSPGTHRSRSTTRQNNRRNLHRSYRSSLDSRIPGGSSENGKEGGHQGRASSHSLHSTQAETLLDAMHKKFCSHQYVNQPRARSVETLHLLQTQNKNVNDRLVHSRSDYQMRPPGPRDLDPSKSTNSTGSSSDSPQSSPGLQPARHNQGRITLGINAACSRSRDATPTSTTRCVLQPAFLEGLNQRRREREEAEIEALEACKWLRAAGFPQYAQMYEDCLFPIDISCVEKDHDFLDTDSIQSLFRRLNTLNKCAVMKIEAPPRKSTDDSDEEDQCALSDKWKYMRSSRRWSRKDLEIGSNVKESRHVLKSSSSHDSLLTDQESASHSGDSPVLESRAAYFQKLFNQKAECDKTDKMNRSGNGSFLVSPRLRRAASERIKSAKNLLKRVESFKRSKSRKTPREITQISGPVIVDSENMKAKIQHLNCKEITNPQTSPEASRSEEPCVKMDTSVASGSSEPWSDSSDNSPYVQKKLTEKESVVQSPPTEVVHRSHKEAVHMPPTGLVNANEFTPLMHSDMDSSTRAISTAAKAAIENRKSRRCNRTSAVTSPEPCKTPAQTYMLPVDHIPGSFPRLLSSGHIETDSGAAINFRTGSFTTGASPSPMNSPGSFRRPRVCRRLSHGSSLESHRASVYDNVPSEDELAAAHRELDMILHELFQDIDGLNQALQESEAALDNEVLEKPTSPLSVSVEPFTEISEMSSVICDDSTHSPQEEEGDAVSGTTSSHDTSDPDVHTELSHDDSTEHVECRERRDSGVGSSLTRAPSDRKRTRIRWHSFQKSHRPSFNSRNLQLSGFSAGQLLVLHKLALLKLTAIMEKYSPTNRTGWNWVVNRLMKRTKTPDYRDKNIFGVPLLITLQRTGQPIPQCMLFAMRYLRRTSKDAVGIFRKSGVRSRIQKLRNDIENSQELMDFFEDLQAYDVADLLKQYFRELPECLLTNKLSETFISIFTHVPPDLRLEAIQAAIILMPDENREVLQSLLLFLSDISLFADEHQMTASNLAVCFAPSLFAICGSRNIPPTASPLTKRSQKSLGVPDPRELQEQKAAHECLTLMILQCKILFTISEDTLTRCRFSYMETGDPVPLEELCKKDESSAPDYTGYVDSCIQGILKESREKFKGWINLPTVSHVDLAYKKVGDGYPLRLWKCSVDVEAPPAEVLNRILSERHIWDEDLMKWRTVEKLDNQTEVFQCVRSSMAPHPSQDYCVLRSWRTDLQKGACVLVSTSIEHPGAPLLGGVRAVILASRYLIEPCGSGKSRLTHISRIDSRGKSQEWYNKANGHILCSFMSKIHESFKHGAHVSEGPETKV